MSINKNADPPTPTARTQPRTGLSRVVLALPYLALFVSAYSVFCVTTDDPFITYRYAANLLAGHGPVFNVGERVEGFSSPLHLLLSVLLLKIAPSLDILFKAKLAGLGFAVLALWQTGRLARAVGLSESDSVLAQVLVAVNNSFALAAINGMETTLALALVLSVVLAFLRELPDKEKPGHGGFRSAALLFLAVLARPEAMLMFLGLLIVRVTWAVRRLTSGRNAAGWAVVFLLPTAALLLARFAYYGQFVPNTYYAKQVALGLGLKEGLLYLLHPQLPLDIPWNLLLVPVPFWAVQWQALGTVVFWGLTLLGFARLRPQRFAPVLLAVVLVQIVFVLRFGGDWMPGWRFVVPVLPILAVVQVFGLQWLRGPGPIKTFAAPVLAVALWVICALISPHHPWSDALLSTGSGDLLTAGDPQGRKWLLCNRYIQSTLPPGSAVAYSEMGYAGYNNLDKSFIDVRGLTDPEIAHLPASTKGTWGVDDEQWMLPTDPLYRILMRRQPAAIIAFSHPSEMPTVVLDRYHLRAVLQDPHDSEDVIDPALVFRP